LAGSVLLSGIWSLGLRHAHAGGDKPHHHAEGLASGPIYGLRHTHPHVHRHGDGRPHSHSHSQDDAADAVQPSLEAETPHVHLWLFGFELTLPDSPPRKGSEDWCGSTVVVKLHQTELGQPRGPDPLAAPLPLHAEGRPLADHGFRGRTCTAAQVLSAPLCDTARFERSGVQVI
jgi:hypothetical protein